MDSVLLEGLKAFDTVFSRFYLFQYNFVLKWDSSRCQFKDPSTNKFRFILRILPLFLLILAPIAYIFAYIIIRYMPYNTNNLYIPDFFYSSVFVFLIFLFSNAIVVYLDALFDPSAFEFGISLCVQHGEALRGKLSRLIVT